jgi:arylsulfatase
MMIPQGRQTKALDIPLDKGPQIVEARRGEPLKAVKPYTAEVRREIDWELVDRGVDFMKRQQAAGKPFFLYLPISRTHFPNLPSKRFEGASRIGQFGDSLMEGDAIVGRMLDALDELGLAHDTIVVFASDNGPDGPEVRPYGGDMPDMGSSGPYRGALGDVSKGSIRTPAMIRWPGHISPRSTYAHRR